MGEILVSTKANNSPCLMNDILELRKALNSPYLLMSVELLLRLHQMVRWYLEEFLDERNVKDILGIPQPSFAVQQSSLPPQLHGEG
jgi:hypothetical protein